jgi:hypothetical protein
MKTWESLVHAFKKLFFVGRYAFRRMQSQIDNRDFEDDFVSGEQRDNF